MAKVPGMTQDGPVVQQYEMPQPVVVNMQGCGLNVSFEEMEGQRVTVLTFLHLSGVIAYQTRLTDEGRAQLVRELTGGVLVPNLAL